MKLLPPRLSVSVWLPCLVFGTFGVFLLFSTLYQLAQLETALEHNAQEEAQELMFTTSHDIENYLRLGLKPLVGEAIGDVGAGANIKGLALLDESGRVIQATRLEWQGHAADDVLRNFERQRFEQVRQGQAQETRLMPDRQSVVVYSPIHLGTQRGQIRDTRIGALWLDYDLSAAKAQVWRRLVQHNLVIWGVSLLLLILLHVVLRRLLTHPLAELTAAVKRFSTGDLAARAQISGNSELAELGAAWNHMGDELAATVRELETNRENLVVTLYSIGDAVIATDAAGRVTLMNAVAEKLSGWTQQEAHGLPLGQVFHVVHAHTRQPVNDPVQRVLATGKVVGLANHTLLIGRDGRECQIADSAAPIRSKEGEVQGVVLVFRDVSEEYALREALRKSEQQYATVLDSVEAYIYIKDTDYRYTYANRKVCELFGKTLAEVVGKTDDAFFDLTTVHTLRENDRRVIELGERLQLEEANVCKDSGATATYLSVKMPLRRSDGSIYALCGISTDITERKRAEQQLFESETKLRTIIEAEPECVKLLSPEGKLMQMNRAGLDMIEADTAEQVLGAQVSELVLPKYRQAFIELNQHVFTGESGTLEFEIEGLKGGRRWVDTHAVPLQDAQGKVTAMLSVTRDITERKRAEQELRIAATAFETQEGIVVTDSNNCLIKVNNAFSRIFGYAADEVLGKKPAMLKSGRHDHVFYESMWDSLGRHQYWQGEIWDQRKDGTVFPAWLTITVLSDDTGNVTHYIATYADITKHKQAEEKIRYLAYFDALTGLPNRQQLHERVQQSIAASSRTQCNGALIFIDLDNFKTLNDTRGHDVGDLLLVEIGKRLQSIVRGEDVVARLGGDEFVVLLNCLSEQVEHAVDQAEIVAEKILKAVMQPFTQGGNEHHSSASIGITLFCDPAETVEDLFKHADAAMYQAKQAGRNAIRFFDPAMQASLEARMALEADMRSALLTGQFLLYAQPLVDHTGAAHAAEILLRWRHPQRGMVSPGEFIPLAEECGLIVPIGQWVLRTACGYLAELAASPGGGHMALSVNVSARQFRQDDFVKQVRGALEQTGAPATRLKLELTESVVLHDVEDTIAKMHELRELGVTFAMDDFGTGQSSLTYLKKLPLDQLKIDQSFVQDIATDADDAVIVQTIISMAKNLKLDVVAEGVETEQQLEFLTQHGCMNFQGYLFGRPMPMDDLLESWKA